MAFIASVEIKKQFEVKCPFDRVFDLLANVPESVSHFPNVEKLVDLGDNVFRWEMKKIGVDRFFIQTIYACKYVDDRKKGVIKWTPVEGEGNGTVSGDWTIKALDAQNTHIVLNTDGELEIPLPRLVKFIVAPVVSHEFIKMVDTYVENLCRTLSKPVKEATSVKEAAVKPVAKKTPAKKTAAKKPATKKAPAKKTAAAEKPAATKAPAKKAAAKKPAAKKPVAKKKSS